MTQWTENVVFHPWVGEEYKKGLSKEGLLTSKHRLLVLGESHYGDDVKEKEKKDLTNFVVKKYVFDRKKSYWFFENITSVLKGKSGKLKENDFKNIWDKIVYYNYVQTLLPKAWVRPTPDDFKASASPFWEILKKLEPTHIWVCGKVLWGGMPGGDEFKWCKPIPNGKMVGENGIYEVDGLPIPALATWHPSLNGQYGKKFICDDWRPIVRKFLEWP